VEAEAERCLTVAGSVGRTKLRSRLNERRMDAMGWIGIGEENRSKSWN
jgi:hypothetical protein